MGGTQMLSDLITVHNRIVSNVPTGFNRYLYEKVNWQNRMTGIIGARGTGKTTLVLQHYLAEYNNVEKCLYISADNPLVLKSGIYNTVSEYFKYYGECVIIDEVHKQENWSIDIKALYDSFPDKKFIILGSSILHILQEKGDLSRRIILQRLNGLSFREYLNLKYDKKHLPIDIKTLTTDHLNLALKLTKDHSELLKDFCDYCENGYYPFFATYSEDEYYNILLNILDKIIYEDIPAIKSLRNRASDKMKKLLAYISTSKIPLFNTSSLTNEIDISKDTLYEFIDLLERAELLTVVKTASKNVRSLKKSKILFKNPNLYHAIAADMWKHDLEKGNIRESFFTSQVCSAYSCFTSEDVDFQLKTDKDILEIEVGGKSKNRKQLKGLKNAFIFKDGIESGSGNIIPLFLAGFLY
jgi:predicted AAA+ superfamily ATPase